MQTLQIIFLVLISISFLGATTAIIIFSSGDKQENYKNLYKLQDIYQKKFIVHPVSAMPYIKS